LNHHIKKNDEIFNLLFFSLNLKFNSCHHLYKLTCQYGDLELINFLIKKKNLYEKYNFRMVLEYGTYDIVKYFIIGKLSNQ